MKYLFFATSLFLVSSTFAQKSKTIYDDLSKYQESEVLIKLKSNTISMMKNKSDSLFRNNPFLKNVKLKQKEFAFEKLAFKNKQNTRKGLPSKTIDGIMYLKLENQLNSDAIANLLNSGLVEYAEGVRKYEILYLPNDPLADSTLDPGAYQYHLKSVKAYQAWDIEKGDSNVVIGVLDQGVDLKGLDFINQIKYNNKEKTPNGIDDDNDGYIDNYAGWDFGMNDNNVQSDGTNTHGTQVSSFACSEFDNNILASGVGGKCKLMPIKITNTTGNLISNVTKAFEYAILTGCKVINLSWGTIGTYSDIENGIIQDLINKFDIVIVAAAGNNGKEDYYYPASYDNVLSVTSTNWNDVVWGSATCNDKVDLTAPGVSVTGLIDNNVVKRDFGSSLAAPIVAGAAALIRSHYPTYKAIQVIELLKATTDYIDDWDENPRVKGKIGTGRLNILRALTETPKIIKLNNTDYYNQTNTKNVFPDDDVSFNVEIQNILTTSSDITITLRSMNSLITVTDSVKKIAKLDELEIYSTKTNPFKLKIGAIPNNTTAVFQVHVKAIGFEKIFTITLSNLYPTFMNLNKNKFFLSIGSNGRMAYMDYANKEGQGSLWKNFSFLYESGLIISSKTELLNDCVRVIDSTNKGFESVKNVSLVNTNFANQLISNNFRPKNPKINNLLINQRSYTLPQDSNTIIIEYRLTNTGNTTIDEFNFCLFKDWDLYSRTVNDTYYAYRNRCYWRAKSNSSVMFNTLANGLFATLRNLTLQKPVFRAISNYQEINKGFTDNLKFTYTSKGVSNYRSTDINKNGGDVSEVQGVTITSLEPNKTEIVAFSMTLGSDSISLLAESDSSLAHFIKLKTGPKPYFVNTTFCKEDSFIYKDTNVTNLGVYSNAGFITKVGELNWIVNNDSLLLVSNQDSIFESSKSKIDVKRENISANFKIDTISSEFNTYHFEALNKTTTSFKWYINGKLKGDKSSFDTTFSIFGDYLIKLVASGTTCTDSLQKPLKIDDIVTGLNNSNSKKTVLYPNPSTGKLFIESNEIITSLELIDQVGNIVLQRNNLQGKNSLIENNHLSNGLYICKINSNGKIIYKQILITSNQ